MSMYALERMLDVEVEDVKTVKLCLVASVWPVHTNRPPVRSSGQRPRDCWPE